MRTASVVLQALCLAALLVVGFASTDGIANLQINGIVYNDCNCNEEFDDDEELGFAGYTLVVAYTGNTVENTLFQVVSGEGGQYSIEVPGGAEQVSISVAGEDSCTDHPTVLLSTIDLDGSPVNLPFFDIELCRGEGPCFGVPDDTVVDTVTCGIDECANTVQVVCEFGVATSVPCEGLTGTPCDYHRPGCEVNEDLGILCPDKCFAEDLCERGVCAPGTPVPCNIPAQPCASGECQAFSGECAYTLNSNCLESQLGAVLTSVYRDCVAFRTTFCYDVRHYFTPDYEDATYYLMHAPQGVPFTIVGRPDSCRIAEQPSFDDEIGLSGIQWTSCDPLDESQGENDGDVVDEWEFCVTLDGIVETSNSGLFYMNHEGDIDEVIVGGPVSSDGSISYDNVCPASQLFLFQITAPAKKRGIPAHVDGDAIIALISEKYSLARESIQLERLVFATDLITNVLVRFFPDAGPTADMDRTAAAISAAFAASLTTQPSVWTGTILEFARPLEGTIDDVELLSPGESGSNTPNGMEEEVDPIVVVNGPDQLTPVPTPTPTPVPVPFNTFTVEYTSSSGAGRLAAACVLAGLVAAFFSL